MSGFRTPLARARGLGSAKSGVGHFIVERATSIALLPLTLWAIYAGAKLASSDYGAATTWMRSPLNAAVAALFILVGAWHAQIGMRVIVEDYIERRATKAALLLANLFIAWGAAALGVIAVLRLAFGMGSDMGPPSP